MKAQKRNYNYKLTALDHNRIYDLNWGNINSFEDFKKAELLKISKYNEVDSPHASGSGEFLSWVSRNPDFEKYFIINI